MAVPAFVAVCDATGAGRFGQSPVWPTPREEWASLQALQTIIYYSCVRA